MTEITVALCTKREEPHFDWAIESLKNQTFKNFEYIIVDSYYNKRKELINQLMEKMSFQNPYTHIPDKLCRWKGKRPAISNARNTAIIFAKGKYIVFHDDNCKIPPDFLEKHLKWLKDGYIVAGNWITYESENIIGTYGWEHRYFLVKEPKEINGTWLYTGNCSFPLNIAFDINGFDEELDGEQGQEDISFGIRAERKGYKIIYDPTCCVKYILSNHVLLQNHKTEYWERFRQIDPNAVVPKKKTLNDGKEHFSSEWLTQKLLDENDRYLPYGNHFNIRELSNIVKQNDYNIDKIQKELEKYIDPTLIDWRDGELIKNITD